jgi:hypothetical protein
MYAGHTKHIRGLHMVCMLRTSDLKPVIWIYILLKHHHKLTSNRIILIFFNVKAYNIQHSKVYSTLCYRKVSWNQRTHCKLLFNLFYRTFCHLVWLLRTSCISNLTCFIIWWNFSKHVHVHLNICSEYMVSEQAKLAFIQYTLKNKTRMKIHSYNTGGT